MTNPMNDPDLNPMLPGFHPSNRKWQALSMQERRNHATEARAVMLSEVPFVCQPVFPTEEDGHHFVYTIGRHRLGKRDWIMTGNSSWGQSVFEHLAVKGPAIEEPGIYEPGYAAIEVDPLQCFKHFGQAYAHGFTGDPLPLQITVADEDGHYLWEPEHYAYGDPTMPMLGKAPR